MWLIVECVGGEEEGDAWAMVQWRKMRMIENDSFGSCVVVVVLVLVFVRRHRRHCYY